MFLALALALAADTPAAAEKKVCRLQDAEIGSMMPKKECKTKAEWAEIAKRNQANADRYKMDRAQGTGLASKQGD